LSRPDALFSLEGRVAVVTGGAGLLGLKHCRMLARAGAAVVMADVASPGSLERARRENLSGPELDRVRSFSLDVTSADSLIALKEYLLSEFGRLDVLVNNAAVDDRVPPATPGAPPVPFEEFPIDVWNRSIAVNLTGVFLACRILGPLLKEKGGSVINIASTYGIVAPDQSLYVDGDGRRLMFKSPVYPATKAGVLGLTKYLASYWGESNIRVNALSPGGVENGQDAEFIRAYAAKTMLRRMACSDDYEGAILFLASDASRYMTGSNLVVDGGWTAW
jgi:NAD(P)-dependent dehydrogenase (short-subunit alcohol dehydrogenase family)